MQILLIEDDSETAAYIVRGLKDDGHVVEIAANGVDGLHLATSTSPDLIIVDRMLPALDGVAVVKALREAEYKVPVLFLTAMGAVRDRVEGLDAGGDDYLVKPFSFSELKARIAALARRPPLVAEKNVLQVGDIKIDRLKRKVLRGDQLIDLQPREYQILDYLMAHADRIVTRSMLLEAIWDFRFDPGTNIVETHMSRLRSKIECPGEPPLIRTIRGAGYIVGTE